MAEAACDNKPRTHLKHAVRLVEHQVLDAPQRQPVNLDQVMQQAAGRRDDHVGVGRQLSKLSLHGVSAHEARGAHVGEAAEIAHRAVRLQRQFARRSKQHRARARALRVLL
eukprot:359766-Chlamydomonas_euryale.AAC.3